MKCTTIFRTQGNFGLNPPRRLWPRQFELAVDPDVLAQRPAEHLGEALIPSRGDPLRLLLERRFASKDDVRLHS